MDFQLTAGQQAALDMVKKLQAMPHDRPKVGILRGCAGTGKTTMIRVLAQEVGEMSICAPTGKAALRVTEATGLPASTIHRLIYLPKEDPLSGTVRFERKEMENIECPGSRLIVVEEASMVNEKMWDDIYDVAAQMGCHVLCVGDPFQLPPVEEKGVAAEYFSLLDKKFKFDLQADLTEITRQARESPIIRASTMIRGGNVAEAVMQLPRVRRADLLESHAEVLRSGGVAICHKNATRHSMNDQIRKHLNKPENSLEDGEPLLVLRNNYQLNRFNGEVLRFDGWKKTPGKQWSVFDPWRQVEDRTSFGLATVEGDEVVLAPKAIKGHLDHIGVNAIDSVAKSAMGKNATYLHCNYGYTLTAHKSQGSEWKNVMVVVEKSVKPFTYEGRRLLYTAITRGKETVSICWLPDDL